MGFFKEILILLGLKQKEEIKILRPEDYLIPEWKNAYKHFFSLNLPENDYPDRKTLLKQKKIFEDLILSNRPAVTNLSTPQTFYTLPDDWMSRISPRDRHFMRIYITLHLWYSLKLSARWLYIPKILDELNIEVEELGKTIQDIVNNFQEDAPKELRQKEKELNRDTDNCGSGVSLLENICKQYKERYDEKLNRNKELLDKQADLKTHDQGIRELKSYLFELIKKINMKREGLLSRIFGWLFRSQSSPAREKYNLLLQEQIKIKLLIGEKNKSQLFLQDEISNKRIQIQILESELGKIKEQYVEVGRRIKKELNLFSGKITSKHAETIKSSVVRLSEDNLPFRIRNSSQFNIIKKHFPINDENKGIGIKRFDDIRRHLENNAESHEDRFEVDM
jgi:hypothetical protein